ncbi:efflux RND transporter periplasmic adaptor subunit [Acinetobacter sp. UBA1496]|uniref:efflux RND transporter periplasmic adaptor subunit n=1 Tax=Acinetobacter sp. UBA1496 TaxID=1945926 RepID=UPI00257A9E63|nr:efflux RND transporter periplasmic adaptor subunit [Acinetobacter sp. UBA1496]
MLPGQHKKKSKLSDQRPYLTGSILCLSLFLTACQKDEIEKPVETKTKIELIEKDLVPVKDGTSIAKSAFTGTLRAVNQSSIQAQVTATATQVYVQVGQAVSKGQVLVRLNNQDNAARLAQARANLSAAQAQANLAKNMMQRKQRLLDQGFISKVEYEQANVDYQAQLENVRAQQANVNIAQKAEREGTIYSPISGVITQRQVDAGQTVAAGQTLFEIVDPNHLEIQAKLPSDMQAALKVGQRIEYTIQGNPAQLTAVLSRISPIADPASRQIEFFAKPNETINSLSIGSFVEGNILASTQVSGQLIPLDVIQNPKDKPYVWVIRQNKIKKVNLVILEQRYRDNLAVVQGLQDADQISRIKFNDQDIDQAVIINK